MRTRLTQNAGAAMRRLRLAKGWTLQQLSETSGVPLSTLSKLELGQSSLTYDKILRICRALDVDPGLSVLQQSHAAAPPSARRAVMRAGDGAPLRLGPHEARVAAQDILAKTFTPMLMTLQPRGEERRDLPLTFPGETYVHVMTGAALLLTSVYAPLRLEVGDGVFFDGAIAQGLYAAEAAPASALVIVAGDEGFWRDTANN